MIDVQITGTEQVRAALLRIGTQAAKQALAATAVEVERYIEQQAGHHHKTGALVGSIYKTRTPEGWEIGHDPQRAPHAVFVHWGTRAHVIQPKNKKTLRWAGGGMFHFAKKINHPGNKADPWMERAAELAPGLFQQHVAAQLARIQREA